MTGSDRLRIGGASIRIDSMPAEGRDLVLSVDAEDSAAIAAQLGITSVNRLDIRLRAVRLKGGIRVTGRLEAEVEQPSVVSLEPVRQTIAEPIDRVFLPSSERDFAGPAGAEIFVDLEGEDVPDHFDGPEADLSGLIVETLSLALDPYPRADGESIEDIGITDDVAEESPFARLRELKERGDGSGS
jgi:uncharacterized metal-binding protein YceD (DUF177 family)